MGVNGDSYHEPISPNTYIKKPFFHPLPPSLPTPEDFFSGFLVDGGKLFP